MLWPALKRRVRKQATRCLPLPAGLPHTSASTPLPSLSLPPPAPRLRQLDSAALQRCLEGREEAPPVLGLFVKDGPRGWVSGSAASKKAQLACPTGGLRGLVVQYTNEGRHRKLADFEDHLDDIARCAGAPKQHFAFFEGAKVAPPTA